MYYLESVRAVAKGMGNILESCAVGQRKRLDVAARHKKTDDHTPADKVEEKRKPVSTIGPEETKDDTKTEDRIEVIELNKEEAPKKETVHTSENGVSNGTVDTTELKSHDIEPESHDQDDEIQANNVESAETNDQLHDNEEPPTINGEAELPADEVDELDGVGVANGDLSDPSEEARQRWSFPPVLEQFDLMETETDPTELEAIFADERLTEIYLDVKPDGPGLGISIVGGQGSPSGDLPIIVKRVLPGSLAEQDGRLKTGDELVAMNEKLLVGVGKDVAIDVLSNLDGRIRLLVLQDE